MEFIDEWVKLICGWSGVGQHPAEIQRISFRSISLIPLAFHQFHFTSSKTFHSMKDKKLSSLSFHSHLSSWMIPSLWFLSWRLSSLFAEHWLPQQPITRSASRPAKETKGKQPFIQLRENSSPFISFMSWTVPLGAKAAANEINSIFPLGREDWNWFLVADGQRASPIPFVFIQHQQSLASLIHKFINSLIILSWCFIIQKE